jgi:Uma2 family endonuclease
MAEPARKPMTVADFLEFDDGTDTRYELVGGAPVALNPPRVAHVEITTRLMRVLLRQLLGPCRPLVGGGLAQMLDASTYRIPDIFVTCSTPSSDAFFDEPRLVIEILSPATYGEDRTAKLDFYKTFASLEAILFVWQDTRRLELHDRTTDAWIVKDLIGSGTMHLRDLAIDVQIDEIYAP